MHTLIAALLVFPPFLLGLNRPLAWSLAAAALLLACCLRPDALGSGIAAARRAGPTGIALPLALAMLATVVLPLLQLAGGTCTTVPAALPCVVDAEQAWLGLLCTLLLILWFVVLSGHARPSANALLATLALAGTLQAAYALGTHYLGITPLLLEDTFRHTNVPTGGFPNRNHLAVFLYLGIFAAIALILRLPADTGTGRAARWRILLDQRLLWRLAVVLMVLALIATRSRAGNAVFLIGLLSGLAWLAFIERPRRSPASPPLRLRFVAMIIASVLLLDALLIGSVVGIEKVQQRIADTSLEGEQRDKVVRALLEHRDLLTGTFGHGSGSFLFVFEPVKPATLSLLYDQAHNDYLQALIERGWLGGLLLAAALLLALRAALRVSGHPQGAELRFALVAATSALLLHAGVEFVSQIPVLWLAWLTLLALATTPEPERRRRHHHDRATTSSRNRH